MSGLATDIVSLLCVGLNPHKERTEESTEHPGSQPQRGGPFAGVLIPALPMPWALHAPGAEHSACRGVSPFLCALADGARAELGEAKGRIPLPRCANDAAQTQPWGEDRPPAVTHGARGLRPS